MNKILKLYREAINNFPLLKYSWAIVGTICLLCFIAFFKLKNADVFFYAFSVLFISTLANALAILMKGKGAFIKALLYIFISSLVVTMCAGILSFASFIILDKPHFYKRWFPDEKNIRIDTIVQNVVIRPEEIKTIKEKAKEIPTNLSKRNVEEKAKEVTLKILSPGYDDLEKMFEKDGIAITNLNPNYKVEISYTGEIELVENNLYRYRGGFLLVKLNGMECDILKNLIINNSFYAGNSRDKVLFEIEEQSKKLVGKNETEVYNKIKQCIK